ncbi:MAG: sulfocyanin-like copper-binding protein [Candidatus Dormibacteraceae bacterium]
MGRRLGRINPLLIGLLLLLGVACNPVTGSGPGTQPDTVTFLHTDNASRSAVLTLIAGYPVTDNEFNYNGYERGELKVTIPVGWNVTVQCQNHTALPNSCAVVRDANATAPLQAGWSTANPTVGLGVRATGTFSFTPTVTGNFRIASLVSGSQASGMWLRLVVVGSGKPAIAAGD